MNKDLTYLRLRSRRGIAPLNHRRYSLPVTEPLNRAYYKFVGLIALGMVALAIYSYCTLG